MNKITALAIALGLAFTLQSPNVLAQTDEGTEVVPGDETSDRTPEKESPTPDPQVDQTKEGETSDRTPSKHDEDKQPDIADE